METPLNTAKIINKPINGSHSIMSFIRLFVIMLLLGSPMASWAQTYKVALFIPEQSPFWSLVTNFMQEAANDLQVELVVYDAKSNHILMVEQVKQAINGPDRVDALVIQNFKKTAPIIIQIAEEARVYSYLINAPLRKEDNFGQPREKFKYWLGEMIPDDTGVAAAITHKLINRAKSTGMLATDGKIKMFAMGGRLADTSSINRIKGVHQAIATRTDTTLLQVFHTDWREQDSAQKFDGAWSRYPESKVVFSASYGITNGILSNSIISASKAEEHILTNSLGLTEDILKQVKNTQIVATSGGHYIEGAWALVQIYDFLNGIDFATESLSRKTLMPIIDQNNVDFFIDKVSNNKYKKSNLRKIDFTQYSKKLTPSLKHYNFDFKSILFQL